MTADREIAGDPVGVDSGVPVPPVLSVRNLSVDFRSNGGWQRVVDDVSFDVARGQTLAIVGESGSGKSVTSLAVMGLVKTPPGRVASGSVVLAGTDLMRLSKREMRAVRGDRIAMVFQEPMTSLNPAFRIGEQIAESVRRHRRVSRRAAMARAVEVLETVGITNARTRVRAYPHEFSGGMRQRVMIALAIACEPEVLIADEPTTALDVTVQAQVLDLLVSMKEMFGMGLVIVTHDFGVVADAADRVMVMYGGQAVEAGDVYRVFDRPQHPYTAALLDAMPQRIVDGHRLSTIPGRPIAPGEAPTGCRFAPRCAYVDDRCRSVEVPWTSNDEGGNRCLRSEEIELEARRQ